MDEKDYKDLSELVGKRVIRRNTIIFEDDEESPEVGIIIHAWVNSELNAIDCYIAFFGETWPAPNEKPEQIPYVLRYFLSSLEEV